MEQTSATTTPLSSFADPQPTTAPRGTSSKQQFTDALKRESATTRRVIAALPEGKSEFKPHEALRTARELAALLAFGQGAMAAALTNNWQWPPAFPPAPESYAEVLASFDATNQAVMQALENTPDARLYETVQFFTAPKQMGQVRVLDLMWFLLSDSIHHRGQFSIYLRMTGGKVPSIYGPSADEPWS